MATNEVLGFRIDSVNPIRIVRVCNNRPIPFGNNKEILRTIARRLGLMTWSSVLTGPSGEEYTTHRYAEVILDKINA